MVFEDESSEETSSLPYMHSTSSTDRLNQVPFSVEDPDYQGLELETMSPCEKHGKASERLVAFEGTDTGRRFLACAEPWHCSWYHVKYSVWDFYRFYVAVVAFLCS
ncbi:hypothetical protein CFC21_027933 [Triticum aestivum]|uniref:Zinc finger GRF-type domain-containing protein n=2 Tax=Triticum aestivum TaxID=4565 RepID=A0A3B6D6J4_WHEAT|nr:hypothetical protein CFC21_027933 [Triticum aestivum]